MPQDTKGPSGPSAPQGPYDPSAVPARAKIVINSSIWARVRVKAYEQGKTASALVEEVLGHWLRYGFSTQIERRLSSDRQGRDGSITLHEVSLVEDTPKNRAAATALTALADALRKERGA